MTNKNIRKKLTEAYRLANQAFELCFDDVDTGTQGDCGKAMALTLRCIAHCADAASEYLPNTGTDDGDILTVLKQFERILHEMQAIYSHPQKSLVTLRVELDYLRDLFIDNGIDR